MRNQLSQTEVTFDNMPRAVAKVYEEISIIRNELTELKQKFEPKSPTEYLTRNQLAEMLKCDLSTIHNWVVKKKLVAYAIGNRVYFKRAEVESSILPIGGSKK